MIVREGAVLARGRNLGRTNDDPTAHGEMVAIRRCLADARLRAAARQHALYIGRTLRDVHGRDPVVPGRPAGLCRRRWRSSPPRIDQIMISSAEVAAERAIRADLDHRRRAGG